MAARGIEAASSKDSEGGFRPICSSAHVTYSLHEPRIRQRLWQFVLPSAWSVPRLISGSLT